VPIPGSNTKKLLGKEKRADVLYVRVKPTNRKWVREGAMRDSVTESQYIDELLEKVQACRDCSNRKKS